MDLQRRLLSVWHAAHTSLAVCILWPDSASARQASSLHLCKGPDGVCNAQAPTSPTSWTWWRRAMVASPAA